MSTKSKEMPVQTPPQAQSVQTGTQGNDSRPMDVAAEHVSKQSGVSGPTLTPPGANGAEAVVADPTAVTGTWVTTVTVDAMWSINETRNAFFHTSAGVWQKVFNGSDSAFVNLTTLVSQAKQTGHQISYRVEADGLAHEVYLW